MNKELDRAKARKAAMDPNRPGERCGAAPGVYAPVINRSRCEGKSDCAAVCPYGVFEVRTMDPEEFRALPLLARLKSSLHGRKTAYTANAGACQACGLCVVACPEDAITLTKRDPEGNPA